MAVNTLKDGWRVMSCDRFCGVSRREFLRRSLSAGIAVAVGNGLEAERLRAQSGRTRYLLADGRWPPNLETPREFLDTFLTPNDVFFVRCHFNPPPPLIPGSPGWKLEIAGMVEKELSLTLADLQKMRKVSLPAVLQCAGNGRKFHQPPVGGVQWGAGAVGHARWAGVRLRDVLAQAQRLRPRARHIQFEGADLPPLPATPAYIRSLPLEKALDRLTLLAYEMNDEPLPHLHGGPLRVVVPGWAGDHWLKWVRRITVRETEAEGFYMQTAYRIPRTPVAPGTAVRPEEMVPVTELNVKSLITRPLPGSILTARNIEVAGVAFTGPGKVVKVELSVDGGRTWAEGGLREQVSLGSWQQWRWRWRPREAGK